MRIKFKILMLMLIKNYTQHKKKYHKSSAGLIGVIAFSWLKRTNFLDSSSSKCYQINSFKQEMGPSDGEFW